jgi:CheY-like chemotaxis protein
MEIVGRLAGGVAHDFNNMLGVILGHVELALDHAGSSQPLQAHLAEICRSARRSADLTRQLLAFARKQPIAPRVLDLNPVVEGALGMLKRLIGEDIRLEWKPGAPLWPLMVDSSQVDQVLGNLCVNARDAITGGGCVVIQTSNGVLDEAWCAAHAGALPGEYVVLAVSDDGAGMDEKTKSHLFEPFFTTKEVGKGTGLGLATVYGIVRQNGGFIDVVSYPGRGSTVTIYLPRYTGSHNTEASGGETRPAAGGTETILLVEDEPAYLNLTTKVLERLGYTVVGADTPAEAIRVAEERGGVIDLLVTDVVMPQMSGRELAAKLGRLFEQMKCLYMSGYTTDVIARHGVLEEGLQFIQKPYSARDLAAKVRKALEGQRPANL